MLVNKNIRAEGCVNDQFWPQTPQSQITSLVTNNYINQTKAGKPRQRMWKSLNFLTHQRFGMTPTWPDHQCCERSNWLDGLLCCAATTGLHNTELCLCGATQNPASRLKYTVTCRNVPILYWSEIVDQHQIRSTEVFYFINIWLSNTAVEKLSIHPQ